VHIGDQDVESLTTRLGLDLSYAMSQPWGVLVPQLTIDWVHEFGLDGDPVVGYFVEDPTREPFRLEVDDPDRDYFNLGVGAVAQLPHGMSGYVFYRKLLGYDVLSMDSVSLGLRLEF
jgi:outer membrane autotransporter protein